MIRGIVANNRRSVFVVLLLVSISLRQLWQSSPSKRPVIARKSWKNPAAGNATGTTLTFPRWHAANLSMERMADAAHVILQNGTKIPEFVYVIDGSYQLHSLRPLIMETDSSLTRARHWGRAQQVLIYLWRPAIVLMQKHPLDYRGFTDRIKHFGGIVLFGRYGDGGFCRSDRPILSVSSPLDCQAGFPLPNYEIVKLALLRARFPDSKSRRQWQDLQPKVIWRGTPTGGETMAINPRVALCRKALEFPDLVDAKLVINNAHTKQLLQGDDFTAMIGQYSTFDGYRAVLDIDGNGWSSRFASLLCSQQVVLKVQPQDVDYFYPTLSADIHYLPVHANLSNLREQSQRAVSDASLAHRIVGNANAWCETQMNMASLVRETARILDAYASIIEIETTTANSTTMDGSSSFAFVADLLKRYPSQVHDAWNLQDAIFQAKTELKLRFKWKRS